MDPFFDSGDGVAVSQPYHSKHIHDVARSNSISSSASVTTNSRTACSSTITCASTHSTCPTITVAHRSPPPLPKDSMAVYYHYDEQGNLQSTTAYDPLMQQGAGSFDPEHYLQRGDVVGAYLARRDAKYPASAIPRTYDPLRSGLDADGRDQLATYGNQSAGGVRHETEDERNDSYDMQPDKLSLHAGIEDSDGLVAQAGQYHPYPNPEDIRHLHTLHSLLPWIHPERRLNALSGAAVDIIEEDTKTVLAHDVPKKVLVLLLGRNVVTKFIGTVDIRKNDRFDGFQKIQKMFIPRGISSIAAMRILLAWLMRACRFYNLSMIRQFNVPHSLFAASTLAQTLTLFGLHKDALRVDQAISQGHFVRPIYADELEQLWNCLGRYNRYTYAAIKVVGERLRAYEQTGASKEFRKPKEMLELLNSHPDLDALVRDAALNEQHRPSFSTEWCGPARDSQDSQRVFNGYPARGPGRTLPSKPPGVVVLEQDAILENSDVPKKGRKVGILRILPARI
ncbi:hypothetical protein HBI56_014410 [Parastagonospora nodorum]|nr:hypothetical protein HBI09_013260 [Parastagonospora nodorum]KAH4058704.1 hypothetical protein HBH49_036620 [Parastagonospora nodorum]KAH4304448.1 hypothetical protein HBI01_074220 [Parastagonospora nodorum]KAH4317460.1 hypothetical protein HBI02_026600 [Parastagonospora nodorum]KAH4329985.1 hypothetical protein HBI00_084360 [Parastagonospora nodorum]